jgi:3-oxoacyl-[acyl-carrier protein] reductase
MSDQSLLTGRGAVVSGGSRGIGRAVTELLCNLGAGVVVNGRDADAVQETVAAITASGGQATRWSEQPTTSELPPRSSKNARARSGE